MKKLISSSMAAAMLLVTGASFAQKSVYIPWEWRNRTDTLIYAESDPDNRYTWSKSRSIESDNVIIFWDKYYGKTHPSNAAAPYHVDMNDLLQKCEAFFDLEINQLGFVDPTSSNLSKYKVMVLMNHTTEWTCFGGGYDFQVSALWLNPATCQPVGHSVAHEIGHSFHYMCYSEASNHGSDARVQTGFHGAVGQGSVTWEQTAQWQANQSYPGEMFNQSIGVFRNSHNYAYTHEWHRYQSYWFFYYLCQKYGDIKTVANVWNHPETVVKDFNQVLMDYKSLTVEDLFRLYYDYAARCATWDFTAAAPYRNSYIGDFTYRCALTEDGEYQVALASCPQSTGFNIIPLNVPAAGTEVTTHFTAMRAGSSLAKSDPGEYLNGNTQFVKANQKNYNISSYGPYRGFRVGYVALLKDGTRRYYNEDKVIGQGRLDATEDVSFTVPADVDRMWLIVSPAPSRYIQHQWDESLSGDDMWPYRFSLEGTDLSPKATVYASATIDDRAIEDITFTYDVYFPRTTGTDHSGTTLTVSGQAAAKLGTAFQMQPAEIGGKIQGFSSSGPSLGRIMFYPVSTKNTLISQGSTANGLGHWFDSNGNVSSYANGYVYSEFDASSLTFTLGQYPGKCVNGGTYTIRQALSYRKSARERAKAIFVFRIHIDNSQRSATLTNIDYDEEAAGISGVAAGLPTASQKGVFTLNGQRVGTSADRISTLPAGIYIVDGKKRLVK